MSSDRKSGGVIWVINSDAYNELKEQELWSVFSPRLFAYFEVTGLMVSGSRNAA